MPVLQLQGTGVTVGLMPSGAVLQHGASAQSSPCARASGEDRICFWFIAEVGTWNKVYQQHATPYF